MTNMEQKDWSGFAEGGADKNGWRTIESAKPKIAYLVGYWTKGPDGPRTWHQEIAWHSNTIWFNRAGMLPIEPMRYQPLPPPPEPSNV